MATQSQMDEKIRPAAPTYSVEHSATPAQLAEKADSQKYLSNEMATPAQLDEKRRGNTAYAPPPPLASAATPAQLSEKAQHTPERPRGRPPPLPPRMDSIPASAPPAYSAADDAKRTELISEQWHSNDPRSSSTHSLVPSESGRDGRRTLLLVYIHGFMGNETSFQSFPAHVHNLLSITLEETHIVHTKIYPRYKSRKAIEFARDDFSTWLEPNENHYTDVVLLGHSMGGILSAEVALQEPQSVATGKPFRHRILGTINFDTPFLGMHPGVIVSGIGSLFRPADPPPGQRPSQSSTSGATSPTASGSSPSYTPSVIDSDSTSQISLVQTITSPLATPPPNDPFFNPPFPNDVRLPERKGWSNLLHFVNKHSDGLTSATKSYFMSHLEFGGAMADYPGLKNRYDRLRALEDVDDLARRGGSGYQPPVRRIRFTNYYTASTGRPKEPKIPPGQMIGEDGNLKPIEAEVQDISLGAASTSTISVDEHGDGTVTPKQLDTEDISSVEAQMENLGESSGVQDDFQEPPEMIHIDSMPMEDDEFPEPLTTTKTGASETPAQEIKPSVTEPSLPPIPPAPTEPEAIDLSLYTDKDSRKIAEKEQKRIMKVYQQAVKDRESAIKDRKKLVEKREKKVRQEREKELKAEEKQRLKEEKEEEKRQATINPAPPKEKERQASVTSSIVKDDKPKRDKKFCMLPPEYGGKRDKCWIRVYMEGVDEVGAHCGLFFPGPQYESLVGDVGARIGKWVEEDATRRAILAAERG
ncbi:hypothetical protein LSUB1_G004269 [Lachnellula subtilissima]|uniref:DUF676 domain-containing protein n=1 Tax=Lachnellula subtilissima TaxID=602034 RepID=A0A8H8RQF9_9HELO|nr:hypothetical protein LSUB1_G004269 [Lachnellula subtilissima]